MREKYFVYILRSIDDPDRIYAGFTNDINRRIAEHNSGSQTYSSRYAPWELIAYVVFADRGKAMAFENYLKTPSGKAFIGKRLV